MPNPKDKRVHHTIAALQQALLTLLCHKTISHITVRELCQEAHVNRSTFYVYYKGIDELMEEIEQTAYARIEEIYQQECGGALLLQQVMEYVQENQQLFRILVRQYGSNLRTKFSDIMQQRFVIKRSQMGRRPDSVETQYLYELLFTGTLGVIQKWLENDCREQPGQLAEMIWRTILFCEKQEGFSQQAFSVPRE